MRFEVQFNFFFVTTMFVPIRFLFAKLDCFMDRVLLDCAVQRDIWFINAKVRR